MPTALETTDIAKKEFGYDNNLNEISIADKYQQLKQIVIANFDSRTWFLTEAALCVHVSCLFKDATNPLALIFIDGPASGKTTVLDFFTGLPMSLQVDKFTPASFLTQSANVKAEKLGKVDLLPKIVYKTMLIPEMGPTFNQPKEMLMENYAILTRVLDGTGLKTSGGIHGLRELNGDYLFGLLGASTPLSQTAWNTMGKVGSRLMFLHVPARLDRNGRLIRAREVIASNLHYKTRKKAVRDATKEYLDWFFGRFKPADYSLPDDVPDHLRSKDKIIKQCGYLPRSVDWDRDKDDDIAIDTLAFLAEFLTACRSDIRMWTERGEDNRTVTNSSGVVEEGVDRFATLIYNFARCHALISGRQYVSMNDIPLALAITLSSLPDDRRKAMELLIDDSLKIKESPVGEFDKQELMKFTSCNEKTAKVHMEKLEILGLGNIETQVGSKTVFRLNNDLSWFTNEQFKQNYRTWERE